MAKKKKKRTTASVRSSAAPGAQTVERPTATAQRPPTTPADSRTATRPSPEGARLNRLARKEEARKQREALRRKMQRRRYYRRAAIVLAGLAIVGGIVFLVTRPTERTAEVARLLEQADDAAAAAGCEDVETTDPYSPENLNQKHIGDQSMPQMPPLSSYPTQPPASGPHSNSTLPAGVYDTPPPMDQIIHSLEHGAVVIWYDPSAPATSLSRIQSFFRRAEHENKVILAPYNYPDQGAAGRLPEGKRMALVAWQRFRSCNDLSLPVAYSFVNSYRAGSPDYEGEAPEPTAPI